MMAVFSTRNFFLLVWIISNFIEDINGLKCFQCTSADDPTCDHVKQNDTDSPHYKDCPEKIFGRAPLLCRKTVHKIYRKEGEDDVRVTRGCGIEVYQINASNCYTANTESKYEISCQCFTDACNKAPLPILQLTGIFLSVAICFLML